MKSKIKVQEILISVSKINEEDFISLTDMAKYKNDKSPDDVIRNWIKSQKTIDFLEAWEDINNPNFNPVQIDGFRKSNDLTPKKWIIETNAIGIVSKRGRYGGTYAHKDVALEFATWLDPKFKLYVIKEFQRLKENESSSQFKTQRYIAKRNYKIQTQAIKDNILPTLGKNDNSTWAYTSEADLLNLAVWGMTAKQWRKLNPDRPADTNIRDYATIDELIVLSNLEVVNSKLIENKIEKRERFEVLCETATSQLKIFGNLKPSQEIK
jgi:hypothetical protein